MTDPAIQAAQRAIRVNQPRWQAIVHGYQGSDLCADFALDAAREALAPLKELHRPMPTDQGLVCDGCFDLLADSIPWPCDNAKLIYPDAELNPEGTTP